LSAAIPAGSAAPQNKLLDYNSEVYNLTSLFFPLTFARGSLTDGAPTITASA
jgi:hypothetical protein